MRITRARTLALALALGLVALPLVAHAQAAGTTSPDGLGTLFESVACALGIGTAATGVGAVVAAISCGHLFVRLMAS